MSTISINRLKRAAAVASVAVVVAAGLAAAPRPAAAQVTYTCPYGYFYWNGYCSPYSWYAPSNSGTAFDYSGLDYSGLEPGWGFVGRREGFHHEGFSGGGFRDEDRHAGGDFHGGGFHGGGGFHDGGGFHGGGGHAGGGGHR